MSAGFWRLSADPSNLVPSSGRQALGTWRSMMVTLSPALSICPRRGTPLYHDSHHTIFKFSLGLFTYIGFFIRQIVPKLEYNVTYLGYSSHKGFNMASSLFFLFLSMLMLLSGASAHMCVFSAVGHFCAHAKMVSAVSR